MIKFELKIIYEDENLLAVDKPAGIIVFPEGKNNDGEDIRLSSVEAPHRTIIDLLIEEYPKLKEIGSPPRYGIVHRLDKDTSGVLLIAKNNEALLFLQNQFKNRTIQKKYTALVVGEVKENNGMIETLIGRATKDRKKQKAFFVGEPGFEGKREAITEYRVVDRFTNYTLLEITPKTGRKHQIRCHLAYINHPITGDKMYGFKNQPIPKGLTRHFLHASYLKFELSNGNIKELKSDLPKDLKNIINELKKQNHE